MKINELLEPDLVKSNYKDFATSRLGQKLGVDKIPAKIEKIKTKWDKFADKNPRTAGILSTGVKAPITAPIGLYKALSTGFDKGAAKAAAHMSGRTASSKDQDNDEKEEPKKTAQPSAYVQQDKDVNYYIDRAKNLDAAEAGMGLQVIAAAKKSGQSLPSNIDQTINTLASKLKQSN